jgi:uncharacterized protein
MELGDVDPDAPFLAVVILSTLCDAAVAGLALFVVMRRDASADSPRIGMRRLVLAAGITALAFLLRMPPLALRGVGLFGWVHLVYVDAVVLLPTIGAGLLIASRVPARARPWRRLSTPARCAAWASLALIPIGIDATFIEPFRLQVETARVPVAVTREGSEAVRIGVLTDLQTNGVTDYERSAVERLMAQKPDVVLLPGDIFQGNPLQFEETRDALRALFERLAEAPGGVFLVLGDTDGTGEHLRELLQSTPVRFLVNETAQVEIRGRRLTIGGIELRYDSGAAHGLIDHLENDAGDDDVRILLAHRPDTALGLKPKSRIDLVVAGHTHGGQIVVPGFGPPMTLSRVPRAVAAGGLHTIGGNAIYVSRGVGCERNQAPRIRFLCPPEVSLLEVGVTPTTPP